MDSKTEINQIIENISHLEDILDSSEEWILTGKARKYFMRFIINTHFDARKIVSGDFSNERKVELLKKKENDLVQLDEMMYSLRKILATGKRWHEENEAKKPKGFKKFGLF